MQGKQLSFSILGAQILILLIQIFIYVPQFSTELVNTHCTECSKDSIHVAAQLGRLDIVSLVMAMFGIVLAVLAFWGFFSIKAQSQAIAHTVATDEAIRIATQRIDWFETSFNMQQAGGSRSTADVPTQSSQKVVDDDQ